MKKVLLLLIVICGFSISTFAQSSEKGRFNIGLDAGAGATGISYIIGGSLKYEHPLSEGLFLTGSVGYSVIKYKGISLDDEDLDIDDDSEEFAALAAGTSVGGGTGGVIPVKVGAKYYFGGSQFFGEAQLGFAKFTSTGGGSAFIYSPGVGYTVNEKFDIGVRYEAWSNNGTIGQGAIRLAYKF